MRIDAHHHFWKYSAEEYGWIDSPVIRRDFLPADLEPAIAEAKIDGVISVQARQTLEETRWLLEMARERAFIRGVVGWVPLVDPGLQTCLAELSAHGKLVGVRHVLQEEPANQLMDDADFNRGVRLLTELGLRYDLLIFARHLPQAARFVGRHPQQTFILDHIAKPDIRGGAIEDWKRDLNELARRENVFCKISGMVTEADPATWSSENLRRYFDAAVEAFGPARLMFGSDWPVCLVASSYARWVQTVELWTSAWSDTERKRFWSGTVEEAYGIESSQEQA